MYIEALLLFHKIQTSLSLSAVSIDYQSLTTGNVRLSEGDYDAISEIIPGMSTHTWTVFFGFEACLFRRANACSTCLTLDCCMYFALTTTNYGVLFFRSPQSVFLVFWGRAQCADKERFPVVHGLPPSSSSHVRLIARLTDSR